MLLSYLIQSQLTAKLKYDSLYEAQVPGRAQSPARYEENVRLALDLLGKVPLPRAAKLGHLDLVTLLDSGIPVWLPGKRKLHVGVLRPESEFVGKTVDSYSKAASGRGPLELIAILRDGEIILPSADTVLQQNDRLMVISPDAAQESIREHLAPLRVAAQGPAKPAENSRKVGSSPL